MMRDFLNHLLKFNNSLLDPLLELLSIETVSLTSLTAEAYLLLLFPLDISFDVVFYNPYKIKVFAIKFSLIIRFISSYSIFCKHYCKHE